MSRAINDLTEAIAAQAPEPPRPNIDRLGLGTVAQVNPDLVQHGARAPEMVSIDYLSYLSGRQREDRAQIDFRQRQADHERTMRMLQFVGRLGDADAIQMDFAKGVARGGVRMLTTPMDLQAMGEGVVTSVLEGVTGIDLPEGEAARMSRAVHGLLKPHLDEPGGILAGSTAGEEGFPWDQPGYWAGGAGEAFTFLVAMMIPGMGAAKTAQLAGMTPKMIRASQAAATFIASTALESGMSYPEFVDGLIERGLSPGEAAQIAAGGAAAYGIVAGALEVVAIDRLLERGIPRQQIFRVLVAMATESSTEVGQELTSFGVESIIDIADPETLGQRLTTAGVLGAGVSAPVATIMTRSKKDEEAVLNSDADAAIEHADLTRQLRQVSPEERTASSALIEQLIESDEVPEDQKVVMRRVQGIIKEIDAPATPPATPEVVEPVAPPTAEAESGLPPRAEIVPIAADVEGGPNLEAIGQVTRAQAIEILDRIGFEGFVDAIRSLGVSEEAIAAFRANLGGTGATFDQLMATELTVTPEEAERIAGNIRGLIDALGIDVSQVVEFNPVEEPPGAPPTAPAEAEAAEPTEPAAAERAEGPEVRRPGQPEELAGSTRYSKAAATRQLDDIAQEASSPLQSSIDRARELWEVASGGEPFQLPVGALDGLAPNLKARIIAGGFREDPGTGHSSDIEAAVGATLYAEAVQEAIGKFMGDGGERTVRADRILANPEFATDQQWWSAWFWRNGGNVKGGARNVLLTPTAELDLQPGDRWTVIGQQWRIERGDFRGQVEVVAASDTEVIPLAALGHILIDRGSLQRGAGELFGQPAAEAAPATEISSLLAQDQTEETPAERFQRTKTYFTTNGPIEPASLGAMSHEELSTVMGDAGITVPPGVVETPESMRTAIERAQTVVDLRNQPIVERHDPIPSLAPNVAVNPNRTEAGRNVDGMNRGTENFAPGEPVFVIGPGELVGGVVIGVAPDGARLTVAVQADLVGERSVVELEPSFLFKLRDLGLDGTQVVMTTVPIDAELDELGLIQPDIPTVEGDPEGNLFGTPTDPTAGTSGDQGDFGYGDTSRLDDADAADRAARAKKLEDDAGATELMDWVRDAREVQSDEAAPPGFREVAHLGLTWHVREGLNDTEIGSEAETAAMKRAIEDQLRRPPRGGGPGHSRRAFVDMGVLHGVAEEVGRRGRRAGRLGRVSFRGAVNWAILDLIDLVSKSGGPTAARAGVMGRASVDTTKKTLGQLARQVRRAMRATGGVLTGEGPINAQRAAIAFQRVEYQADEDPDSPLMEWGTARGIDLIEGRLEATSPAEQKAVNAIRDLINRTGEIFLSRQHLQFNFRTGQWEVFRHIPGGRVYPRIMHADLIAVIGKGQGREWTAIVKAITAANADFIADLVEPISDEEAEAGLTVEQKFEAKVDNFLQQLREAFMGQGGPSTFHRINAEFTRSIPRFPSHVRLGETRSDGSVVVDDELVLLETHPYTYARRLAENAAHRVGFIEQFGQAIGGWQIVNTETGEFMKHGATKSQVNALFKGLNSEEKNLRKMKLKNLAGVVTALNQFVLKDADAQIPDALTKDEMIEMVLQMRDQLGVGEETEIVLEQVPNVVDDMRKALLREPGNSSAHFLVLTRVLNGMPAEIPILTAGNPVRRVMRGATHLAALYRAGLLSMAIIPNIVEPLGNIQALNNTNDLMRSVWSVLGGARDADGKLHSNMAGMIVTLESMGAITADLANIAYNPNRPFESLARVFREGIGRVVPRILLEEFQERIAGIAALHKVNRMQAGNSSEMTIARDALDLMAMMSWPADRAKRVARAEGTTGEYESIVRRAPAFMTGGAIRAAEKTRLSNNNIYRVMIAFELYAQIKIRSFAKLTGAYQRAYEARDARMFVAANEKMARYLIGTTLAGQLQHFLLALVTGGWDGVEIAWEEMLHDPWKAIWESFSYAMFAGPYGSIIRLAQSNDGAPLGEQLMSMTLPGFVMDQTVRMLSGSGQYTNMEWGEKVSQYFQRMLPVTKVYDTSMALLGFGHSRESLKMNTAVNGYWRWRFDSGRRPATGDRGDVAEEIRAFRIGMRQAYQARMRWDDPVPGIQKALGSKDADAKSVGRSILGKRLLTKTIAGRKMTAEDTRDLIATIGQDAYNQLVAHDAILTGWAASFKGTEPAWAR